jgi:hypothetical protein
MKRRFCQRVAALVLLLASIPATSHAMAIVSAHSPHDAAGTLHLQQQVGTIVGRATDVASGEPVPNASVYVVGTGIGTLTGEDGRFRLTGVPAGEYRVRFERLGYESATQTVTVPPGGTVTVDFLLGVEPTRLEELVVTATGEQRREVR